MNPFEKWTEEVACTKHYAIDANNNSKDVNSPYAVKWCAEGWAKKNNINRGIYNTFCDYIEEKTKIGLIELNDSGV